MPFELNKLVEPQCGGANPLVATARQIASRPSGSRLIAGPAARQAPQRNGIANFSKEFLGQQLNPVSTLAGPHVASTTSKALYSAPSTTTVMAPAAAIQSVYHHPANAGQFHPQVQQKQLQQRPTQAQLSSLFESQLETKYRNDILSQTISAAATSARSQAEVIAPSEAVASETTTTTMKSDSREKVDDVEFWQSLSQQYIGPPTFVAPSETEYIFDERNPLKDQFEDPFAEGLKKLEQGDIPSAALLFEAAVLKDPENATAWRYLGTTQAQNEKDISAIRALKNCLKIDSNDQEARLALSVSLANENYKNEACHYLLEWLINHDKYKTIRASFDEYNLLDKELAEDPFSMNSLDQKHYNYVRDKFVEAARMAPNNPDHEIQNSLGVLFNMQGEYEKAVDCFKAALSVRSNDSLLWNRLGATLANGNKSDEAVIAYRKALEISPGFLRSRYNLAISLIHLNTYDEAAKQLVQILNMQAAGKGSKNAHIRMRSITSTAIWNTLRTVATLLNRPDLYAMIDGRDLARCNEELLHRNRAMSSSSAETATSN